MIEYVSWCELCQQGPATGQLTGYFGSLPDELLTLQTCEQCAAKAFEEPDIMGIR